MEELKRENEKRKNRNKSKFIVSREENLMSVFTFVVTFFFNCGHASWPEYKRLYELPNKFVGRKGVIAYGLQVTKFIVSTV